MCYLPCQWWTAEFPRKVYVHCHSAGLKLVGTLSFITEYITNGIFKLCFLSHIKHLIIRYNLVLGPLPKRFTDHLLLIVIRSSFFTYSLLVVWNSSHIWMFLKIILKWLKKEFQHVKTFKISYYQAMHFNNCLKLLVCIAF